MKPKQAFPALAAGMLTALLLVFGIWPVLANGLQAADSPAEPDTPETVRQPAAPGFTGGDTFSIPASAFGPDGVNPMSANMVFEMGPLLGGGGGYLVGNARNYGCVQAPIYLPDGQIVQNLNANVYDNDSNRSVVVRLQRVARTNGLIQEMAAVASGTSFAEDAVVRLSSVSINQARIDNDNYQYFVNTCLTSSQTALYTVDFSFATRDLGVSLYTSPMVLLPGTTTFSYRSIVTNLGTIDMQDVQLSVDMPAQATIDNFSTSVTCTQTAQQIDCPYGTLAPGEAVVLQVDLSLPSGFQGSLTAQAAVTSSTADDFPENNVATLISAVGGPPIRLPVLLLNATVH
ncbi:MAG: hypothetical protein ACK2UW_16920 [Anaerolineales bacterium]|jgi:hypothetical protein